jgi:hypothetical protein
MSLSILRNCASLMHQIGHHHHHLSPVVEVTMNRVIHLWSPVTQQYGGLATADECSLKAQVFAYLWPTASSVHSEPVVSTTRYLNRLTSVKPVRISVGSFCNCKLCYSVWRITSVKETVSVHLLRFWLCKQTSSKVVKHGVLESCEYSCIRLIYWTWKHNMHKAMPLFRVKLNDKCGHPRSAESSTNLTVIHIHKSFCQLVMAVTLLCKLSRYVIF